MIRQFTSGALLAIYLLVPCLTAADPAEVTVTPATRLSFATDSGKFYQLESRDSSDQDWQAIGDPVIGNGKSQTTVLAKAAGPKTTFRLRPIQDQWVKVWADEFDDDKLDTTRLAREENGYGGGNNEKQFYSTDPKYSQVSDGKLRLAVYRDPHTTTDGKTQPYSSARIRSLHRGDWLYGRFEICARVPGGEGIWPAAWMLPSESKYGTWAASGEIDILESRGNQVDETVGTIHFGGTWPRNTHLGTTWKLPGKNAAQAFHVYAIEWQRDEIRWYVDDHCYQTITNDKWNSEAAPDSETAPFDQPFHLILNLAVDGGFFDGTDQKSERLADDAFPQVFEIDYVRVYQWAPPQNKP